MTDDQLKEQVIEESILCEKGETQEANENESDLDTTQLLMNPY